ncbi:transcriptional repressor NsrR [Psychromonas sp. CNPT3]|uniref:nitric oxide-sensing transcriptional repressor NsrR n=1 Tax=Psychromonas sp. CNPT3 TaxID=314282 RepID=UPI00006E5823|nr:nitric oxide-sensing transcriptional repressor NsrR [Psychromonas sp. CNPT3]AGH80440.1 transcriptional repressor NsrR [Psychromonas sp. CNPT3]
MQLTTFTDYGLRTLIYLAILPKGELADISSVANIYNVSRNHMVKVISKLSKLGYIDAVRGKNGGIRLGIDAHKIFLGDVIQNMESMNIVNCNAGFCHIVGACQLKGVLASATNAFLAELNKHTILSLVEDNVPLVNLLGVPIGGNKGEL